MRAGHPSGHENRDRGPSGQRRRVRARVINAVTSIVVGIIVIGILLVVLEANRSNEIVSWVVDAARWLVGPFHDLFRLDGDWRTIVNWGLAALVSSLVGRFLAGLLARS